VALLLGVALSVQGVEQSEEESLLSRVGRLERLLLRQELPSRSDLPEGALNLLETDHAPVLGVSAKFQVGEPQIGEAQGQSDPTEQDDELKQLQQEIDELKAKVAAAERKASSEETFEQQQASMQEQMLEQKLKAKMETKQLELNAEAQQSKRRMTHQLERTEMQASSDERSAGNAVANMKLELKEEQEKAQQMQHTAKQQAAASTRASRKQGDELAEMRAKAQQMESEMQRMETGNVALKAQAETVAQNVKNIAKQSIKLQVAGTSAQHREKKAADAKLKLESDLKEADGKAANLTMSANHAAAEAEQLTKELAKEQTSAAGVKAQKAQLKKLSNEVLHAESQEHREKFAEEGEKLAFEGRMKREEHKLKDLEAQKASAAQEATELQTKADAAIAETDKDSEAERSSLKNDLQTEHQELIREMKAEAATAKAEREELRRQINITQAEAGKAAADAAEKLDQKRADDKQKRIAAVEQVAEASQDGAAEKIKAEYATAMATVDKLKQQGAGVEAQSQEDVKNVQQNLAEQLERMSESTESKMNATRAAAEAKVGDAGKLIKMEQAEMSAAAHQIEAATDEANAREKSAIERAMEGEKEAVEEAVKEAIHFAQDKAQAADAQAAQVLQKLGSIITNAGTAKTAEEAKQGKLDNELASAKSNAEEEHKQVEAVKHQLSSQSTKLQDTHTTLGTVAAKVRDQAAELVKQNGKLEEFQNANTMLTNQLNETQYTVDGTSEEVHKKIKLKNTLKGQLKALEEQLAAANVTENALKGVKELKQEEASTEQKSSEGDSKANEAVAAALKSTADKLKQESETAKPAETKSFTWSSMLGF
jgi:hypothetical protein